MVRGISEAACAPRFISRYIIACIFASSAIIQYITRDLLRTTVFHDPRKCRNQFLKTPRNVFPRLPATSEISCFLLIYSRPTAGSRGIYSISFMNKLIAQTPTDDGVSEFLERLSDAA